MPQSLATSVTALAPDLIGPAAPAALDNNTPAKFGSLLRATRPVAARTLQLPTERDESPAVAPEGAKPKERVVETNVPSRPPIESNDDLPAPHEQSEELVIAASLAALASTPLVPLVVDLPAQTDADAEVAVEQPEPLTPPAAQAVPRRSIGELTAITTATVHAAQPIVFDELPFVEAGDGAEAQTTTADPVQHSSNDEPRRVESAPGAEAPSAGCPDKESAAAATSIPVTSPAPAQPQQAADATAVQVVVNPNAAIDLSVQHTPLREIPAQATEVVRQADRATDSGRLLTRVARAFAAAQRREGEIHIRLSPPELGSLRLDVRVHDGELSANVQTETDAARAAILDNLPALRERLADQGLRIERFDVDLMQRQDGGTSNQAGGRQHDAPAVPPRFIPAMRERRQPSTSSKPRTAGPGSTNGLNVIV